LKVISAFANSDGGKLKIDIDDNGKPIGVKHAKKLLEDIPNKARDIMGIIPDVGIKTENGKEIIVITIKPSSVPISYHGSFYVRSGSTNLELKGKELSRFLISKSDKNWDEFIEERFSVDDLDIDTIEKFRNLSVKRLPFVKEEKDTTKLLQKLNLVEDGKFKRAAALLFSKNPKKYFTSAYRKIDGYKQLFEENGTERVFNYNGFKVRIKLLLRPEDVSKTLSGYRQYWFDKIEKMVKVVK